MTRSGTIRNRKRTEIIIIDIIILLFLNNVSVFSLLPFRGGEYCEGYKLIIVIIVIDEKFLRRKKYDLPIHPYIFALSN